MKYKLHDYTVSIGDTLFNTYGECIVVGGGEDLIMTRGNDGVKRMYNQFGEEIDGIDSLFFGDVMKIGVVPAIIKPYDWSKGINWKEAPARYTHHAVDKNGNAWFYIKQLVTDVDSGVWISECVIKKSTYTAPVEHLKDWEQSLVQRPEEVS